MANPPEQQMASYLAKQRDKLINGVAKRVAEGKKRRFTASLRSGANPYGSRYR